MTNVANYSSGTQDIPCKEGTLFREKNGFQLWVSSCGRYYSICKTSEKPIFQKMITPGKVSYDWNTLTGDTISL